MLYLIDKTKLYQNFISNRLYTIFGISSKKALFICGKVGLGSLCKFHDLTRLKKKRLFKLIEKKYLIGDNLVEIVNERYEDLISISSYRGRRHKKHLPSRGQRTRSNAKTRKKLKR